MKGFDNQNILDLSNKAKTKIVREVILQPRSKTAEILRVVLAIIVVSFITWTISMANDISGYLSGDTELVIEKYSVIGNIKNIDLEDEFITLDKANTSQNESNVEKKYYVGNVSVVETSEYVGVSLGNLMVGDRVIFQGDIVNDEEIILKRIITFGQIVQIEVATSTEDLLNASSTLDIATSTATTTDNASSTPDELEREGGSGGGSEVLGTTTDDGIGTGTTTLEVDNSTTTPEESEVDTGTTTPEDPEVDNSTTTPEEPEVENGTTTPEEPEVGTDTDNGTTTESDPEPEPTPDPEPTPEPELEDESEPETQVEEDSESDPVSDIETEEDGV